MYIAGPNVLKVLLILAAGCIAHSAGAEAFDHDNIPLPEHPRADWPFMESVSADIHSTRHLSSY